jgi:hypothetical protein
MNAVCGMFFPPAAASLSLAPSTRCRLTYNKDSREKRLSDSLRATARGSCEWLPLQVVAAHNPKREYRLGVCGLGSRLHCCSLPCAPEIREKEF